MKYKWFKQTVEQFIQNHTRNIKNLSPSEQPPAPISILPYAAWHSFDCTLCLIAYNSLYSNFPSHIYKYFFFSFSVRSKIQPHIQIETLDSLCKTLSNRNKNLYSDSYLDAIVQTSSSFPLSSLEQNTNTLSLTCFDVTKY